MLGPRCSPSRPRPTARAYRGSTYRLIALGAVGAENRSIFNPGGAVDAAVASADDSSRQDGLRSPHGPSPARSGQDEQRSIGRQISGLERLPKSTPEARPAGLAHPELDAVAKRPDRRFKRTNRREDLDAFSFFPQPLPSPPASSAPSQFLFSRRIPPQPPAAPSICIARCFTCQPLRSSTAAMNQDAPMSWPEQPHDESMMHPAGDDEFSNFLEFGINFPDLEGHGSGQRQRPLPNSGNSIPTTVGEQDMSRMDTDPTSQAPQYNPMVPDMAMDLGHHGQNQVPQPYGVNMETSFYPQDQQQHHQHQHQQQQQQQQYHQHQQPPSHQNYAQGQPMIPPTPNSVELHGGAAQYPQRVEENHDMYDRYTRVNEEQAFYTPLISPAMTPLDTQFRMPEYTIPGEYFTPLTSPALEARNSNTNGYPFQTSQGPDMGFIQSPVDVNGVPVQSAPSSPGLSKKQQQQQQRRRPSATTRMTGRAGKQSPLVRPQTRRKQALSTQLHSDEVLNALEQNGSRPTSGGSGLRYGSNESDSVSPEPLSEPLMPPPALPQSRKSPAMGPQTSEPKTSEAATPATLMRIQKRPHMHDATGHFSGQASLVPSEPRDEVMEDVQLPEAATDTRPKMSRIDNTVHTKDQNRSASSEKTPSIEPKSATERPPSSSVTPSPHPGAMPSPSGPTAKKPDTKAAITRKRQSVSSQISPALRPRISPSIQPLVRGDAGISSETSALYLASKSNYQHILDGTLLPGVSYPETLAENLSSKRTNHKLAEQGRRNRINTALKEIESLLPPGFAQERSRERKEAQGNGQGTPSLKPVEKERANHAISKASTVEMAIDYIKLLKKELEETKQKLKEAESKLEGKEVQGARNQAAPATGTEAEGKNDTSNSNAQPVAEESKSV